MQKPIATYSIPSSSEPKGNYNSVEIYAGGKTTCECLNFKTWVEGRPKCWHRELVEIDYWLGNIEDYTKYNPKQLKEQLQEKRFERSELETLK